MEVIEAKQLMLTNFEVLQLLQELRSRGDAGRPMAKSQSALATITYETVKYLEGMACSRLTEESLTAFMTDIEPFKLTKQDKIHLLNLRPTTAVEIQLMVQDSEGRLTDEQVEQLIEVVAKHISAAQTEA